MTLPFENSTNSIVKKIAKRSMQCEKRRNLMVVISVMLAAFLISFAGGLAVSFVKMQSNLASDTYEAVYTNITEQELQLLKQEPEFSRVGEYYYMGEEPSKQGFIGSFLYADNTMMYIGRQQMKLVKGRIPNQRNEILVSESWLKKYAPSAKVGDMVCLETERFPEEYIVSGIMDAVTVEETKTYGFILSKEHLKQDTDYNPTNYRAYIHMDNEAEMSENDIRATCERIAEKFGLSSPTYNTQYFTWASGGSWFESLAMIGLLACIVLLGGCVVIQSIFRISIIEKIQSFGQLRALGATKKQIARIVTIEGHKLGWRGVILGTLLGAVLPSSAHPQQREYCRKRLCYAGNWNHLLVYVRLFSPATYKNSLECFSNRSHTVYFHTKKPAPPG